MRWIDQLPEQAINHLPPAVYKYFRRGSAAEHSLNEAATAWDDVRFRPRVLRDVSRVSTATTLLGSSVDTSVLVAPSTLQLQCDPAGDVATATGTTAAGSLICVTSNTGVPFKQLTGIALWWVQTYVLGDRGLTRSMLDAAVAVFLGRPVIWALVCHGGDGVRRVLADITAELAIGLALAGARSPADVTRDLIA